MADIINIGQLDPNRNLSDSIVKCFVKAIHDFETSGKTVASASSMSFGLGFQNFCKPIVDNFNEFIRNYEFDTASIATTAITKSGATASSAYATFCKNSGLLDVAKGNFGLSELAQKIYSGEMTSEEYAFLLLCKQGTFVNNVYCAQVIECIAAILSRQSTIDKLDIEKYTITKYSSHGATVNCRFDILVNTLFATGLVFKNSNSECEVVPAAKPLFNFIAANAGKITPTPLRKDDYYDYAGKLGTGFYEILDPVILPLYSSLFPKNAFGTLGSVNPGRWFQKIYMGAPGTGKTTEALEFAKRLPTAGGIGAADDDIIRTTFHPASDYASFVGCYRPESYPDPTNPGKKLIKYEYCEQPFVQAYLKAWNYKINGTDTPVVLIIEEINRANCAQAFGDVFQLLDRAPASAITPEKSLQDHLLTICPLSLSNGKMNIPDNLSILATMNTSDQSLFPIDSAFLRRWEREYVSIDYSGETISPAAPVVDKVLHDMGKSSDLVINLEGKYYKWIDFLRKINEKIGSINLDEKKLGNYAIKNDINIHTFVGSILSYLWDSVFKDLDTEDEDTYFLRHDKPGTSFKFWDIVDASITDKATILQGFMDYLDVPEIKAPTELAKLGIIVISSAPASPTIVPTGASSGTIPTSGGSSAVSGTPTV